jgi:hypothetical protein
MTDISTIPCSRCGGPVIEFTVPNHIWNAVVRKGGPETDKEYLCAQCFAADLEVWHTELIFMLDDVAQVAARGSSAFSKQYHMSIFRDRLAPGGEAALGRRVREFIDANR